jgi:hypothetical protein
MSTVDDATSSDGDGSRLVSAGSSKARLARRPSQKKAVGSRMTIDHTAGHDESSSRVVERLEQQLLEAKEKQAALVRSSAKRLVQIATLERELETERRKNQLMAEELMKQTQMMDRVLNFRDEECARDVNELTRDKMELAAQLEVWRDRARVLQQERWAFVRKFRCVSIPSTLLVSALLEPSLAFLLTWMPMARDASSAAPRRCMQQRVGVRAALKSLWRAGRRTRARKNKMRRTRTSRRTRSVGMGDTATGDSGTRHTSYKQQS